jgi:hypothetical protein
MNDTMASPVFTGSKSVAMPIRKPFDLLSCVHTLIKF